MQPGLTESSGRGMVSLLMMLMLMMMELLAIGRSRRKMEKRRRVIVCLELESRRELQLLLKSRLTPVPSLTPLTPLMPSQRQTKPLHPPIAQRQTTQAPDDEAYNDPPSQQQDPLPRTAYNTPATPSRAPLLAPSVQRQGRLLWDRVGQSRTQPDCELRRRGRAELRALGRWL